MLRSFHYRTKGTLVMLYKAFVRPHLEYAVGAWCPWTEKDCETLEKVQKRFVRSLCDAKGTTYEEKLQDAQLTTLKERRWRGDLIEAFKTTKGINNVKKEIWFDFVKEESKPSRGNSSVENGKMKRKNNIAQSEAVYTTPVACWGLM